MAPDAAAEAALSTNRRVDKSEANAGVDVLRLIDRKREGGALTAAEISGLIASYLAGEVAEEQMSALLMAGVIRGFSTAEAESLTSAYLGSGEVVDLSGLSGPTVDKHSTGGVGDTATLLVAPMAAACGLQVAKLSGRGLGHTGGTLDKLESIPGFQVDLSMDRLRDQVERIGLAIAAATEDLVPADRRLYALRDVTGTIASPALIAASVMSKKLAGGADHILLDVKTGPAAFLRSRDEALDLARLCVALGEAHGRHTRALVTAMAEPLADAIGNALEVGRAIEVLRGETSGGHLADHGVAFTAELLQMTGTAPAAARERAAATLADGTALEKFRELVAAQGGDPSVVDRPWEILPVAPVVRNWQAQPGWVASVDALALGIHASRLGAGRRRRGEAIDPSVGLEVLVRVGDEVRPGDDGGPTVRIHARRPEDAEGVLAELDRLVEVVDREVAPPPWLLARVPDDVA